MSNLVHSSRQVQESCEVFIHGMTEHCRAFDLSKSRMQSSEDAPSDP